MRPAHCGRPSITALPMLLVMQNNRAYHQEVMHIQRMANRHQRGITNAGHRDNYH